MFDFSHIIDLQLIWAIIIAIAIFLYVLLDGFDLGIGILFPFAPSDQCRDKMMNSIAPFWDGNETWLVLGGGGLFAAFPLAYSILMPAFYMPIMLMLLGLIMRGVAFEFRFKAGKNSRRLWDYVFHFGSLGAAFCQGTILGGFIQGVQVNGRNFAGGPFDWATAFSIMTGIAVIFGYALLGSTWLIMKTEDITQKWSNRVASYVLCFVGIFMILVSVVVPFINERIKNFWFSIPNLYYLSVIPFFTAVLFLLLFCDLRKAQYERRPFFCSIGIFLMWYLGLGLSIFPWLIPYHYTIWDAAAYGPSLSLMLCGVVPLLPLILGYTSYCYYVFREKSSHEAMY
ncbi:cytochrome d ubiquinol oxidase subunit II [Candidatus Lariskella endosymbiont of Hedychridium roseum]|uniref:cytochrome d ubiquinol oxidase subunit II n=1 Tax=Candidatus Lariskella endosymbiont of Hedychridium roseum TaxID=3077949 RepID=UPI0030D3C78B